MKKATLEHVQARLGEYVANSAKQPVLILREGEPVAILVGLGVNEKRTRSPARLRDILRRAWQEYEKQGGIPHQQFWDELAKEMSPGKRVR